MKRLCRTIEPSNAIPEWQIIDLALHAYAKVGVSLYDTLGKDSVGKVILTFDPNLVLISFLEYM